MRQHEQLLYGRDINKTSKRAGLPEKRCCSSEKRCIFLKGIVFAGQRKQIRSSNLGGAMHFDGCTVFFALAFANR
jgi:hypothetical protein